MARNGPKMDKMFILNNGLTIPQGEVLQYEYSFPKKGEKSINDLRLHSEYIVYDNNQVKIRYLIEVE
jgi:hypothetical protein